MGTSVLGLQAARSAPGPIRRRGGVPPSAGSWQNTEGRRLTPIEKSCNRHPHSAGRPRIIPVVEGPEAAGCWRRSPSQLWPAGKQQTSVVPPPLSGQPKELGRTRGFSGSFRKWARYHTRRSRACTALVFGVL